MEFCVSNDDLSRGSQALASAQDLFAPADETEFSIYTEYRRAMPRFRFRDGNSLCVVLFPDIQIGTAGLLDNVIPPSLHQYDSEYSLELDDVPSGRIPSLPFPVLGPLLTRYCLSYVASKDVMAAMAIDGLIDGMDLDEQWCMRNLSQAANRSVEYVLSRVRGKVQRIDYYQDNTVTCIIADEDEGKRLLKVPGREKAPLSVLGIEYRIHWNQIMAFVRRQKHNLPHSI